MNTAPKRHQCEDKLRHASQGRALIAGRELVRKRDGYVRAYECPVCAGWHLTRTLRRMGR